MSKSLSIFALALFACEPITTRVVELPERDAGQPVREEDATSREPAERDSAVVVEKVDEEPDGCLVLLDQTLPELLVGPPSPSNPVLATTALAEGCDKVDAGVPFTNGTVFSRRDGERLVERGRRYSYRWKSDTAMARINLRGADQPCAEKVVVNREAALQVAPNGVASCYSFVSPIDARYLRTTDRDYYSPFPWLNLKAAELRLCPAACPAGTEHDYEVDAGTPDAAIPGYDATTPALPTWP